MTPRSLGGHVSARVLSLAFCFVSSIVGCTDPEDGARDDKQTPDAGTPEPDASDPAATTCESTWQAIQKSIFEAKSCAAAACHSEAKQEGGLSLEGDAAYDNLINKASQASLVEPLFRVHPGEQALSFLYLKLAAATDGSALPVNGGSPMPVGTDALTKEELAAVRLWIRAGAPREGVVAGTQELLDCAQPADADPNKAPPPPVPLPEEGFQHAAGPWKVGPNAENEVCFATYYDLSDTAPEWARFECEFDGMTQTCVGYNRRELSQDAQSHHSIISVYAGGTSPTDPSWGIWRCAGGELEGSVCDPTQFGVSASDGGADCGERGVCQAEPRKMTGCTGFGPDNKEATSVSAGGSQAPVSADRFPEGVYARLPIKGVVLWNSHGFNLTKREATIEQFNTFWYAQPEQRVYLRQGIFTPGVGGIGGSSITVLPYRQQEVCGVYTLPRYARLNELSSHAHKRSILWRTWLPPNDPDCSGASCMPNDQAPDYLSMQYNDPVVLSFDPLLVYDQEDPAERTLKFCSVYDNGEEDETLLKRESQLPEGASCRGGRYCVGGDTPGEACTVDDDCGAGGTCDACMVTWGVTTEDEMFFLMGAYHVQPPTE